MTTPRTEGLRARRWRSVATLAVGLALGVGLRAGVGRASADDRLRVLRILTTNDIHGRLAPDEDGRGGVGPLAARVERERIAARDRPDRDLVLVDAGDLFSGSAEDSLTHGTMMTEFAAALGYDVFVPGNHEFDHGPAAFRSLVSALVEKGTAVLCANLGAAGSGVPLEGIRSSRVIPSGTARVGFIGVLTESTPILSLDRNVREFTFSPAIEAVRREVDLLRGRGVSNLVLVSHLGMRADLELAAEVPDLDLIIGGHSHTLTTRVHRVEGTRVSIVQAGSNLRYLGRVDLKIDGDSGAFLRRPDGFVDLDWEAIPLAEERAEHPLRTLLERDHFEPVRRRLDRPIGTLDESLARAGYKCETTLGRLVADAALARSPGAEVALISSSSLRSGFAEGVLRVRDVFRVLPFENELIRFRARPARIRAVLDEKAGPGGNVTIGVSGLEGVIDSSRAEGERILELTGRDGRPLEEETFLTIVAEDFMVEGKGGFTRLGDVRGSPVSATTRDAVVAWLEHERDESGRISLARASRVRIRDRHLLEPLATTRVALASSVEDGCPGWPALLARAARAVDSRATAAMIRAPYAAPAMSAGSVIHRGQAIEAALDGGELLVAEVSRDQIRDLVASLDDETAAYPMAVAGFSIQWDRVGSPRVSFPAGPRPLRVVMSATIARGYGVFGVVRAWGLDPRPPANERGARTWIDPEGRPTPRLGLEEALEAELLGWPARSGPAPGSGTDCEMTIAPRPPEE